MKYKALFLDLDGTTVKPFTDLPTERVAYAIKLIRPKLHVSVATGRLFPQAKPILDHLELNGPCVVANGVQIYDPNRHQIIKEIGLAPNYLPQIYEVLQKYQLTPQGFSGTDESPYTGGSPTEKILSLYLENIPAELVDKIIYDLQHLSEVVVHKLLARTASVMSIEICNARATKQHGIVDVSQLLGVRPHEIIGVGDGYNDFPLLMACGLKFAMGNAVDELKEVADFVAPSVEHDGVAVIVEKFLLPLLSAH